VNLGSIQLRFDGVNVTSSATISGTTTEGAGATITYTPSTLLLPNSTHTIGLQFSDGSVTQSNQWAFTAQNLPLIPSTFALASAPGTNFNIQIHKAPNDTGNPIDNTPFTGSSWQAERQLANKLIQPSTLQPYTNEAANTPTNYGFYTESLAVNYEQNGDPAGFIAGDKAFPGLTAGDPRWGNDPNHIAMAATIRLPMAAGAYRMGVRSDDGFKVTAGTNNPANDLVLGIYDAGRGSQETAFDFFVATNGVYTFRLLYSEVTGGADVEWYWINRTTGARELVRPLALESAAAGHRPLLN
jgi:hypothetical protein